MDIKLYDILVDKVKETKEKLENFVNSHSGNYNHTEMNQYRHLRASFESAVIALGNFVYANIDIFDRLVGYKDFV